MIEKSFDKLKTSKYSLSGKLNNTIHTLYSGSCKVWIADKLSSTDDTAYMVMFLFSLDA